MSTLMAMFGSIMIAFLLNILIIIGVMWAFFRYMYPKPPPHFFAKAGEDTRLRRCSHCGHSLATYRGILENEAGDIIDTPALPDDEETKKLLKNNEIFEDGNRFFCNDDHRQAFYQAQQ